MLRNSVSVHRGRISPLEIRCMFLVLFCFSCVWCLEEVVARTRAVVLVFFLGSWAGLVGVC